MRAESSFGWFLVCIVEMALGACRLRPLGIVFNEAVHWRRVNTTSFKLVRVPSAFSFPKADDAARLLSLAEDKWCPFSFANWPTLSCAWLMKVKVEQISACLTCFLQVLFLCYFLPQMLSAFFFRPNDTTWLLSLRGERCKTSAFFSKKQT